MKEDVLMQRGKKYYFIILIPPYIFQENTLNNTDVLPDSC